MRASGAAVVLVALCGLARAGGPAQQAQLPEEEPVPGWVFAAAGIGGGVANGLGVVPSARIEAVLPAGWAFGVVGSSKSHDNVRETSSTLVAGYRLVLRRGPLVAWGGLEVGAGVVAQTPMLGSGVYSGEGLAAPIAGASLRLTHEVALGLEGTFAIALVRRDGQLALVELPAAWLGITWRFDVAGT